MDKKENWRRKKKQKPAVDGLAIFNFMTSSSCVCRINPSNKFHFAYYMIKIRTKQPTGQSRRYPCRIQAAWNTKFIGIATLWKKVTSTANKNKPSSVQMMVGEKEENLGDLIRKNSLTREFLSSLRAAAGLWIHW